MFKKSSIVVAVFLLLFVFFRLFIVDSCSSKDAEYSEVLSSNNAYLGDQSCKKCHTTEHHQWKQSDHYMSMLPANDTTVKGNFNNVTFTADGITSQFYKKGSKFYINTEGDDGKNHDFEVKYIFGYKPLQQYLVQFPGGRLQVPRLSWDVNKKKWFNQYAGQKIPSHDWLHWTGNAQNWNTMCASCHSTNLHKNYDTKTDTYKTSYSVINVSCESCHGAGQKHLGYVNSDDYKSGDKVLGSFMKLGKKSGQLEQINTCAPCHARVSEISSKHIESTEIMDNYIPEIPQIEFFYADGQVKDEDYIYTSFLQSKMFSKGVKCSDCHNPHSTKLKRSAGNQTCTQCHVPTKYDTPKHTFHTKGTAAASCVNCHMPSKVFMGNDLRHDHSFRVPRPDLSVKYGTPNACSNCHKDQTEKALANAVVKWYGPKRKYNFVDDLIPGSKLDAKSEMHLTKLINSKNTPDIIKATAAFYLSDINTNTSLSTLLSCLSHKDAQVRYRTLQSLANFSYDNWINEVGPLLTDKVRAVRIAAADLFISIPKEQIPNQFKTTFESANKEQLNFLKYQTDFAVGNIMLADYYYKTKDYQNAESFYLKGLRKDNKMNYAYLNLSTLYNEVGQNEASLKMLKKALENDKSNERIYYNLALLYNEMNQIPLAEASFNKAIELKSTNPKVYYNYGLFLNANKNFKKAESIFLKGIAINPGISDLYYGLVFVYIESGNTTKAQETVMKLKQMNPSNPNYQELFKSFGLY